MGIDYRGTRFTHHFDERVWEIIEKSILVLTLTPFIQEYHRKTGHSRTNASENNAFVPTNQSLVLSLICERLQQPGGIQARSQLIYQFRYLSPDDSVSGHD